MNTKLTLSLDSSIIERAKNELQTKDKSLSKITEDYFRVLINSRNIKSTDSPVVREIAGIANIGKNKDEKDIISTYLLEKYK